MRSPGGARSSPRSPSTRCAQPRPAARPRAFARPPISESDLLRPRRSELPERSAAAAIDSSSAARSGLTDTTARDADSPKSVADIAVPDRIARDDGDIDIDAQCRVEAALGHVTARPPSAQSCADRITPAAAPSTSRRCKAASRARSSAGGTPRITPCTTLRYSLPPSSSRLSPSRIDHVAGGAKRSANHQVRVFDQPDDTQHRRRQHASTIRLVVETDVAASDRNLQRAARRSHAFDGPRKLPHDLGPLWIGEVEAVGRANRLPARAGDVARRFGDRELRPGDTDRDRQTARCSRPRAQARAWCPSRARRRHPCLAGPAYWSAPCGRTAGRPTACSRSRAKRGAA